MVPLNLQQCHHRDNVSLSSTLLYCLSLSSFFVCSLYAFVPASIRRLPRDHVQHIKWRSGVILGVMIICVGIYPWLWCRSVYDADGSNNNSAESSFFPWYRYLGFSWQPLQDIKLALHVWALYLGSLNCTWLKIYHHARIIHLEKEGKEKDGKSLRSSQPNTKLQLAPKPKYLHQSFNYIWINPTMHSFKSFGEDQEYRWMILRNLGIAPLAEEVTFRACLLAPLLAAHRSNNMHLSPTQVSWIAPLFFGIAHLHHFYEKYRQLPPSQRTKKMISQLLLTVTVQWTYTTLFGAYVSHVFLRTGSLSGVTLAHVICNYMGLPDVSFAHPTSNLHGYKCFIGIMYLLGIGLFATGFDSFLFPEESVLPSLLHIA